MTAPTRPKVYSIAPMISARSRSPATLSIEMDSSRVRASSSLRTGVLPTLTTCLGRWTDVAGLVVERPPGDPPVEAPADRREVLPDRGA